MLICAGANRGLGLKFVEKFVAEGWEVFGSIRAETHDDPSIDDVRCSTYTNVAEALTHYSSRRQEQRSLRLIT